MKISIITAFYNGFNINRLYLDSIKKYTYHPYEFIVIDNASTDKSAEWFKKNEAIVISNKKNYSYPYSQNQGIQLATGDYLFFLNNDIIVSPHWDKHLIDTAIENGADVISAKGFEQMGNKTDTKKMWSRWNRKRRLLSFLNNWMGGEEDKSLQLLTKWMYGSWENFCKKQWNTFGKTTMEGIVGNNIMLSKRALEILGNWDKTQQAADHDLLMRIKKRREEYGDINPAQLALGVYIHHYWRYTVKNIKYPPFADEAQLSTLDKKWTEEEFLKYNPEFYKKIIKNHDCLQKYHKKFWKLKGSERN